jgi:hypothetical protein
MPTVFYTIFFGLYKNCRHFLFEKAAARLGVIPVFGIERDFARIAFHNCGLRKAVFMVEYWCLNGLSNL